MVKANIIYKKEIDKINVSLTEDEVRILKLCTGAMSQHQLKQEWRIAGYGGEEDCPAKTLLPLFSELKEAVEKIDEELYEKTREDEY